MGSAGVLRMAGRKAIKFGTVVTLGESWEGVEDFIHTQQWGEMGRPPQMGQSYSAWVQRQAHGYALCS